VLVQVVNGLKLGIVYAIVATGYSIVYSILRLINFAHGDIMCVACTPPT
jgi:branched-chain amino acid transport system permease protein